MLARYVARLAEEEVSVADEHRLADEDRGVWRRRKS